MVWDLSNKIISKLILYKNHFAQPAAQFYFLPTNPDSPPPSFTRPIRVACETRTHEMDPTRTRGQQTDHILKQSTGPQERALPEQ